MQAVVCIKWKCTSTEYEIRFIAYEFDSHRLTLPFNSQRRTGRRTGGGVRSASVCPCICQCVHMCVCQTLPFCSRTMAGDRDALSSMLLLAGPHSLRHEENSCFMSMSGCEPCPRGSPHPPSASPPPCVQSHRISASDINPLRPVRVSAITLCFHSERKMY